MFLIGIPVIFGLIGALALIAISYFGSADLDATASAGLQTLQAAVESYATAHNGNYPLSETDLTSATPPYLNESYCGEEVGGFRFDCKFSSKHYVLQAIPRTGTLVAGTKTLVVSGGQNAPSSSEEKK